MATWLIVASKREDGQEIDPWEKFKKRCEDHFWGVREGARNKDEVLPGDQIIFYLGEPYTFFLGPGKLYSGVHQLSSGERQRLTHTAPKLTAIEGFFFGVDLKTCGKCKVPDLIPSLSLFQNKDNWQSYLQGSIINLPQIDYEAICKALRANEPISITAAAQLH